MITSTACVSSVFLAIATYRNMIFNQSPHTFFKGCFLNLFICLLENILFKYCLQSQEIVLKQLSRSWRVEKNIAPGNLKPLNCRLCMFFRCHTCVKDTVLCCPSRVHSLDHWVYTEKHGEALSLNLFSCCYTTASESRYVQDCWWDSNSLR